MRRLARMKCVWIAEETTRGKLGMEAQARLNTGRWRQEDREFKAILSCIAWLSQNQKRKMTLWLKRDRVDILQIKKINPWARMSCCKEKSKSKGHFTPHSVYSPTET